MEDSKQTSDHCDLEKELLAPSRHVETVLEKLFINKMVRAFNYWLKLSEEDFLRGNYVTDTAVKGIFLIDDIQDSSTIRREVPTAHLIYGVPLTLNSALLNLAEASQKAFELIPNGVGAKLVADQLHEMWTGQGTEIYWIDNFICPTEKQYEKMSRQKTGAYIVLVIKLLQLLSDDQRDYDKLLSILGYYSQLRDDYCNLRSHELNKDGRFWLDLTEGKYSLPIIHAAKTPFGPEVLHILRKRTSDIKLKKYCLSLLEKAGSLQYTRDRLVELDREARAEMTRLGYNPLMEKVLDGLNSWKDDKMFT
ncbi:terpene synthase-like [Danaus plexippus]|uniref:terpene synthase-like n=1 Tax=Danaus plexippus TaxID=13037 RepID=UPI0013C4FB87|nr:terpene synthase-like [Danaus plexippus]